MENLNNSDALHAARRVADHALRTGVLGSRVSCRPVYQHMGAVLADSVLQAGLNYAKVVKPRIATILRTFPHATTMNILMGVIEQEGSPKFLQWEHREKVLRFDNLLGFMAEAEIDSTFDLSRALRDKSFRMDIRKVRGVGPKTVDYMACLVGVDCIAVDRHIRGFAELAGLEDDSYDYLREVFSFAADLLSISRREFDASIWRYQSEQTTRQLSLEFMQ
ncbi:hypothetical protein JMM59_08765 [Rhodovulum sulfidophilum]|uniref:hypothetical protein n=1 Tax=Rhodovulum sulfidophilum TaxID=35806 RepID=UPI0019248EC3|nr:hypothetical protein [Rhodovulum sulfidophilum]MBL3565098.1 hypothetical protein [Rhodovulum sulfidophilum]